jgi:hypothetical protein
VRGREKKGKEKCTGTDMIYGRNGNEGKKLTRESAARGERKKELRIGNAYFGMGILNDKG